MDKTSIEPNAAQEDPSISPQNEHPKTFYKWGAALTSARRDGDGFFSRQASEQLCKVAVGDGIDERYIVRLNSRTIVPDPNADPREAILQNSDSTETEGTLFLLQLKITPNESLKTRLKTLGVELFGYVNGSAWFARGDARAIRLMRSLNEVRAVAAVDPRDKLTYEVYAGARPPYARLSDDRGRYHLIAFEGTSRSDLESLSQANDAILQDSYPSVLGPRFELHAGPAAVGLFAADPRVQFIEFIPPPVASRDAVIDETSNVNDVRDNPPNLSGDLVTVMVREIQTPTAHNDFSTRLILKESNALDTTQHATQVIGVIAGSGVTRPEAKGVAPKSRVEFYFVDPQPFDTGDLLDTSAKISNHSYGPVGVPQSDYTTVSADWDAAILNKLAIPCFAAPERQGTSNPTGNDFLQIDFFVGCKNGVCVTATKDLAHAGDPDDTPSPTPVSPTPPSNAGIADFADFGPMKDGRIKPDIAANGETVTLLSGTSGISTASGTSFSTPAVAGILALIYEHFRNQLGGEPRADLAKAILLNSATDLGSPGPDARHGFGIANAKRAIRLIDQQKSANTLFHTATLTPKNLPEDPNPFVTFDVVVTDPGEDLKVMLVWLDQPGSPTAAVSLVQDLDLSVSGPIGGTVQNFFPYKLNPASPANAATNNSRNNVDNVEQVVIPVGTLQTGTYRIRVEAFNIPAGAQTFSLVVSTPTGLSASLAGTFAAPIVQKGKNIFIPKGGGTVDFKTSIGQGSPNFSHLFSITTSEGTVTAPLETIGEARLSQNYQTTFEQFTTANVYTVKAEVTDSAASEASDTIVVEVLDFPTALLSAAPTSGQAPYTVIFNAGGSNSSVQQGINTIETYFWDFGDGVSITTTTPIVSHTYNEVGTYTASLYVQDIVKQFSTLQQIVIVANKPAVGGFGNRLRGTLKVDLRNPERSRGTFLIHLIVSELAMPRAEARIRLQELAQVEFEVAFDLSPDDEIEDFEPIARFRLDNKGRGSAQIDDSLPPYKGKFQLKLARKGEIVVRYNATGEEIVELFERLGFDAASKPTELDGSYAFKVLISEPTRDYRGIYKVDWNFKTRQDELVSGALTNRKP